MRAIDLGGVHRFATGSANLADPTIRAKLGIVAGNNYSFDLFFAERKTIRSVFMIETTLALVTTPEPGTLSLLALGGGALLQWRRRRTPPGEQRGSRSSGMT